MKEIFRKSLMSPLPFSEEMLIGIIMQGSNDHCPNKYRNKYKSTIKYIYLFFLHMNEKHSWKTHMHLFFFLPCFWKLIFSFVFVDDAMSFIT